jgi:thymidylate synthase
MIKADKYFIDNLIDVIENGTWDENPRPRYETDGAIAHSKFITQVYESYNLQKNEFPIATLRPTAWKSGIQEIRAFYQEQTNDLYVMVNKYNLKWWMPWNIGDGTHGIRYGETVRRYDLMNKLLDGLVDAPFSRRHIISLWQEQDFIDDEKGLKPCFFLTEWAVRKVNGKYYLDLHLNSRSSDFTVASTINRVQYVALQMMVAKHCGYEVGKFSVYTNNLHLYDRHFEQAYELLKRTPSDKQPILKLNVPDGTNFYDITIEDFTIDNYEPVEPQLKFELAV